MKTIASSLITLLLLAGCAGVAVRPTTDSASEKGLRFYQSAPYLLIVTDNKGSVTAQVIYLPDTSRLMAAYFYNVLASNDATLKFKNGYLTSATADIDTGVVPKAILNAIATAALARFNMPEEGEPKRAPGPYLYKIVVSGNQAKLIGTNETIAVKFGSTKEN